MRKTLNILYLANSGEIFGGGQISLLGLIKGLDKERFSPLVVCPAEGSLVDELNKMGIETQIIRMQTLRTLNIFSWIATVRRMVRLIRERGIDLIHSNGSRATIYGGIAARLSKVPLIWHLRIADPDRLVDMLLVRLATKIIVISEAVGKRLSWLKDRQKITIIYNGIDLERFNPTVNGEIIREEFHLSHATPLVGIVGRLDWYKGHQYFLQAADKITDTISDVHFLIVGDGERRRQLENLTRRLNLNQKVIFTGNRKDIPQILASLDVFVLSSVSEGFGRSVAEAMACACPVVATNAGGIAEIIEDGRSGILVPSKDAIGLAGAIEELLKDRQKADRIRWAGFKRVTQMFSLKENVQKTEALYNQLMER